MSLSLFHSFVLELSFLTAERHIDTSKEERSGSIDCHIAFSIHFYNTDYLDDGSASSPFRTLIIVGLECTAA